MLKVPDLVVTNITPLAASLPYKADAAAPFNTLKLSIELGSISASPEELLPLAASKGTPFTTRRGWLFPVIEEPPLITIRAPLPGWLEALEICTPATLPLKALTKLLVAFTELKLPPSTSAVAYPKALFSLLIPKAVTTTSLSASESSSKVISIVFFPLIGTSWVENPT